MVELGPIGYWSASVPLQNKFGVTPCMCLEDSRATKIDGLLEPGYSPEGLQPPGPRKARKYQDGSSLTVVNDVFLK